MAQHFVSGLFLFDYQKELKGSPARDKSRYSKLEDPASSLPILCLDRHELDLALDFVVRL